MMLFYYLMAMLLVWLAITIFLLFNTRKILFLRDQLPAGIAAPSVTVIIPVRNEEDTLADALESVCHMDYPNYRVLVVNDRSTDATGDILKAYRLKFPELQVLQIDELPAGWLGKNHAMQEGYLQSDSQWILFTDADIQFDKNALGRAVGYALAHELDHLTIFAQVRSRSVLLRSILQTFSLMLELRLKPWDARNPASDAYMGIGAFNLVRRGAYQQVGTHSVIRLRPDDDLQLGRLIKHSGFRQDVLYGEDQLSLEWYTSVGGFIQGLMKNMFSVSDYRTVKALGTAISTFLVFCLPLPAALLSGNITCVLAGMAILLLHWVLMKFKPGRKQWWDFLMISYAGGIMTYIILKSTWVTVLRRGISWRDSFYTLEELRKGQR